MFFFFCALEMEKLETSELQSRLSSLSVSSFPGITSKNCEANPLNRFVNFYTSSKNGCFRVLEYVNLILPTVILKTSKHRPFPDSNHTGQPNQNGR